MLHRVLSGSKIGIEQVLDRMMAIVMQIHNSCDLDEILKIIVREVREILGSDRAIIYRFLPDGDGVVAEECVSAEWTRILGQLIYDPCFNAKWSEEYQKGRVGILEDIDATPLDPCYKNLLRRLQVRANLVVPILVKKHKSDRTSTPYPDLWGLLIVHQCSRPRQWHPIEIKFLQQVILQFTIAIQQIELHRQLQQLNQHLETPPKQAEQALQQQTERERMIYQIAQHIRQSLDLDETLNTTVAEVRDFLQTDRVIIYRFNPDWSGVVVKESVAEGWQAILNMQITDTYFVERQGQYQLSNIKVTSDIYTAGFSPCHVELLERLQVRAKLVVPILQGDQLWGLLVAHHCSAPRQWHPWERELLEQLATQIAIAIQQSELHQKLQLANQQLENLAMIDQLTQIANRRFFDHRFRYEWHRLTREQQPLSLLLCDIDYFKQYNDTYGHGAGDICLTLVAQTIKHSVQRSADLVVRYGGEEFAVILPNTDSNGAVKIAKKILVAMEQLNLPHVASGVEKFVTLSIGIATMIPTVGIALGNLFEAADRALYQAKANGRNCWFIN